MSTKIKCIFFYKGQCLCYKRCESQTFECIYDVYLCLWIPANGDQTNIYILLVLQTNYVILHDGTW